MKICAGIYPKIGDENDFLLYPVLTFSHAEDMNARAWTLGIRFGLWGVYVGIIKDKRKKGN